MCQGFASEVSLRGTAPSPVHPILVQTKIPRRFKTPSRKVPGLPQGPPRPKTPPRPFQDSPKTFPSAQRTMSCNGFLPKAHPKTLQRPLPALFGKGNDSDERKTSNYLFSMAKGVACLKRATQAFPPKTTFIVPPLPSVPITPLWTHAPCRGVIRGRDT